MGNTQNSSRGDQLALIKWIEASQNPWHIRVLDVRPVTLTMLSTSKDPRCAANAISFRSDDGTGFIGINPSSVHTTAASLRYPIDAYLADGVLFSPEVMEHKWAIFLHGDRIIFVRSWLRHVCAVAEIERKAGFALVTRIHGAFTSDDESPEFAVRAADYLIRTHAMNLPFPAPLPAGMEKDSNAAAMWCMSAFGKMAEFAVPHPIELPLPSTTLRTHSLLHFAVARADRTGVIAQLDAGVPVHLLSKDGLAPLHWAVVNKQFEIAELLIARGCSVDVRSSQQATPLMNAVQSGRVDWTNFLLLRGADPNARDARGFTALHRAAEMGKVDQVQRLLVAGARVDVEAEGHTPLLLARARNQADVVRILTGA